MAPGKGVRDQRAAMLSRFASPVVFLAIGCADPASPYRDIELAATVSAASFVAGDVVVVTIVATNSGSSTRRIISYKCQPPFEVARSDGTVIEPVLHACAAMASNTDLAPGESKAYVHEWKGHQRPPLEHPSRSEIGASILLPAGTYTLRGKVVSVYSPPIEIQIK